MTDIGFFVFRAFFITIMTLGMMACLTDFRFERRKILSILAVYSVWVIISSAILLWLGGELLLLSLFFFFISIPAIALAYWSANDTPAQAVFNYITQIMFSLIAASMIRMLTDFFEWPGAVNILLMGVFYLIVIGLEWHFLRQPFRMLIRVMPTRWGALTLIPCAFCIYLIFMAAWPGSYTENIPQRIYLYSAMIPIIIVYITLFRSLLAQYRLQMERQSAALLAMQVSALKEKLQRVKEVEDGVRIQRHDMRHQLQTVRELVARGDRDAAMDFLNAAQKRLDEQKEVRWCRPPVLDAVFSSYFDQARRQNIRVETKISLPDTLPVDESELAIVLANALENAIHANMELPQDQREIYCKMVGSPSIMLEISNPCTGNLLFDSNGLPVAQQEGHGMGVQSICAFCKKSGAVCHFDMAESRFRFRLVL